MKMHELLLLFTRATRQSPWDLHLASLEAMIPYFFVHDLQYYARLIPECIAQVRNIKIYEEETWKFFEYGNFSVNKSHFPFSAIGADHGIEQLNRELKVVGGVKGLLQNENALHHFILCTPVLDSVCEDFCKRNNLKKESRDKQYQLTDTINSRIIGNVDKLLSHFKSIELSFESSEHMYNIGSNAVLSESIALDIANQQSIGKKMYENFKSERIYGEKSIWDAMKKCKLQTFKSLVVMIKTKIERKLIELKEDKQLLQCVLTILQKRPEINLPKLIGKNEFSNIPRSMFSIETARFYLVQRKDKYCILLKSRHQKQACPKEV